MAVRIPRGLLPLMFAFSLLGAFAAAASADDTAGRSSENRGVLAPPRVLGFTRASAESQLVREARACSVVRPDTLRKHLRVLTATPHVAGTPADRATAEYVRQRLEAYGWETRIEEIPVYLDYPRETVAELVEPQLEPLAVRERGIVGDKDGFDAATIDAFHGYGASGEVTAPVVYANYGDVDDLKKLAALGIDVRGKVVLVRYGKIFRGLKVRNAERAGAAAVLIYSDPADDGYVLGDAYPAGPARPADAIQRGSVQFNSEEAGDPSTPGWPSKAGGKRLKPGEMKSIPRIPSLPLAWAEAQKILTALAGPPVPPSWQGGLPLTYHVGEGPAKVHLRVIHDAAVRPIWNVIATLRGRGTPDQWVLCGNHRDAWTYGAIDPNSGTIAMMEMARSIGTLAKTGWRPRRSLMLCSWDGEEYGLLGSAEWAEARERELTERAVAYLNIDVAVAGKDFRVNGCHALRDVLVEAMREVSVAGEPSNVFEVWKDRIWSETKNEWSRKSRERRWRGEPERPFEMNVSPLGSGSDYTVFVDHLGIPAIDIRFEGMQGTYHSMYDDLAYSETVVDPGYAYHAAITQLWTRVALRLAEADVVPLRYSNTGQFVLDELQSIEERIEDANRDVIPPLATDLEGLRRSATRLRDAARGLEQRVDEASSGEALSGDRAAKLDAALLRVERALLGAGLPGRPWFRHEIYAPGLNTGYAPVPLPRLGQAVIDRDRDALRNGAAPIREALDRAAEILERAE